MLYLEEPRDLHRRFPRMSLMFWPWMRRKNRAGLRRTIKHIRKTIGKWNNIKLALLRHTLSLSKFDMFAFVLPKHSDQTAQLQGSHKVFVQSDHSPQSFLSHSTIAQTLIYIYLLSNLTKSNTTTTTIIIIYSYILFYNMTGKFWIEP